MNYSGRCPVPFMARVSQIMTHKDSDTVDGGKKKKSFSKVIIAGSEIQNQACECQRTLPSVCTGDKKEKLNLLICFYLCDTEHLSF